ncbi:MAG: PDZ domain-containing protein [Planctomycetaceae bacterium]|nr:PDZ domain-containing protein [Planctomycetaceae bacterium]
MRKAAAVVLVVVAVAAIAVALWFRSNGTCPFKRSAAQTQPAKADDAASDTATLKKLFASVARVEYTVQYDKGEAPRANGSARTLGPEMSLEQERPIEVCAFVVSPTRVISPDLMIHPRFIKKIEVRFGEQVLPAKIAAVAEDHEAVFIDTEKPLAGVKPLVFDAAAKGPYRVVEYDETSAEWYLISRGDSDTVLLNAKDKKRSIAEPGTLVITRSGTPVAVVMDRSLPLDDSWKGSPLNWKMYDDKKMQEQLDQCRKTTMNTVLRVSLSFRSPKKMPGQGGRFRGGDDEDGEKTERKVLGVLLDDRTVLVLAPLTPKITARLERVGVFSPEGKELPAKFEFSLKDYGGFVAKLDAPLAGGAPLSQHDVMDYLRQTLLSAEVRLQGEALVPYFMRSRIMGYSLGWKRMVYPDLAGRDENSFIFDTQGKLVAFPLSRRPKPGASERRYSGGIEATPVAHIKDVMKNLVASSDPGNVPLTQEQENRLAWLGVVMQSLDPELARVNNVSDLTHDGRSGALVAFVYPGSPAAKIGLKLGDVLLRIHVKDRPAPIELQVQEYAFSRQPFPWNRLDQVPDQYYDEIPTPWAPAEDNVTRALTDIGFGKDVEIEYFADGKLQRKTMPVEASPAHYVSAARQKNEALGLTVAEMTYEVRRYFHKETGDPGVICAKIEPGSKISVAGVKPYEVITHVNNRPIVTVKDFAEAVKGQSELRLDVVRMTRNRVVKIGMGGAASQPASGPTSRPNAPTTGAAEE